MKWNILKWKRPCFTKPVVVKRGFIATFQPNTGVFKSGYWRVRLQDEQHSIGAVPADEWAYVDDLTTKGEKA